VQLLKEVFAMALRDRIISDSPAAHLKYIKHEKPIRLTPTWEQFKTIVANVRAQVFNADAQDSADFLEFLGLAGLGQAEPLRTRDSRSCRIRCALRRIALFCSKKSSDRRTDREKFSCVPRARAWDCSARSTWRRLATLSFSKHLACLSRQLAASAESRIRVP